ncbi:hypothetical protein L1887_50563 [Cichorium endivia]|nr:hypothetical protein L1887_50563 [Cichorium endivia]
MRRPPPDRRSIVNSMGLPPRDPVAEPTSPTYYPTFPRSRRDSNASGARRSERSFGARRADDSDHQHDDRSRRSAPRHYDDDRRRQDPRRADRDDGRRRFESLPAAPRSRKNSIRRPALPDFDENRDRDVLDDLDEEDVDQLDADDARSDRRRSINPPRRSMAPSDRPAVVAKPVRKQAERDHDDVDEDDDDDKADLGRRRRSVSNPYGAPEPYEEYSNARYVERAPARSVSNGNMSRDYRRKSTSARPSKPSSYNSRDARRDDLERSAGRDSRRSDSARNGGGLLSRVLSRTSGSSRSDLNGSRMERSSSRLNRYSERQPGPDRRDESEIELARIEEEEMLLAMKKRRSAANRATNGYDQDDPRWYRDDRDLRHPVNRSRASNTPSAGLERSASGVRRSMDRERHRTLATLERNHRQDGELPTVSRTDAVARARSQSHSTSQPQSRSRALSASRSAAPPQRASREAALAAITGVSAGAAAASVGRGKSQQVAQDDDQDSESEVSSVDDDLLHDAPEPADVHDDEAVAVIVAKPVLNGSKAAVPAADASASKKVPETTSDDEQDSDEDSDEDSTEQTSDEPAVAKAAPAISAAMVRKPSTASKSSSQIVATSASGRAAPKGYMNFTRKSPAAPAAAPVAKPVTSKDRAQSESEASSEDSEEEEVEETPKPSRATPAAAIAALSGGAVAGAGLLSSKRSSQADKDQRRAAKLQAEQEQKAAEAQARADKAEKSAERRKAKQEASAAAAAAALAAKEAKRSEKIKMKEARQAELERKRDEESQARDRAIREREEAEEKRLLAIREKEREREDKAEARRQSRRRPHGAGGPKMRDAGVKPLTPQQRHYLLKALVMLQMQSEWAEVEKLGALTEYGYPFSSQRSKLTRVKTFERGEDAGEYSGAARDPYANDDAMREGENLQEPLLLRHLFHVHLHSFPGLDRAPEKYWQKRIQPFFDEMAARNFSTSIERGEISKRRLYALAATRYLGSFVSRGFGVRGEGETRGPGLGEPGTEKWGVGKKWGKGTVKRGLDRPERIDAELMQNIDNLFDGEGGRSLIQRVFSYVIGKEAAYIQKEFVVPLRKEIDDPELTKKIEDYVRRGDRVESRRVQREAKKRGEDVLTTILLTAGGKLGGEAENHVLELQRCFALSPYRGNLSLAYPETTPAGADQPPMPAWGAQGAEHTRARKFALLKLLLRESLKRRDREQAVELASGSLIPAIIKDSLETVFYPAIREIAGSANLSERLGDLQKFIDDMLETKKKGGNSIEDWIALAARHEQSLYVLFHDGSAQPAPGGRGGGGRAACAQGGSRLPAAEPQAHPQAAAALLRAAGVQAARVAVGRRAGPAAERHGPQQGAQRQAEPEPEAEKGQHELQRDGEHGAGVLGVSGGEQEHAQHGHIEMAGECATRRCVEGLHHGGREVQGAGCEVRGLGPGIWCGASGGRSGGVCVITRLPRAAARWIVGAAFKTRPPDCRSEGRCRHKLPPELELFFSTTTTCLAANN